MSHHKIIEWIDEYADLADTIRIVVANDNDISIKVECETRMAYLELDLRKACDSAVAFNHAVKYLQESEQRAHETKPALEEVLKELHRNLIYERSVCMLNQDRALRRKYPAVHFVMVKSYLDPAWAYYRITGMAPDLELWN